MAQTAGQPQPDETLPGFKETNLLEAHGIDNINLYSGDPGVAIPIGPKFPLGSNYSWQLSAHYSSKFWGLYQSNCNLAPSGIEQRASITGFPTLGVGWSLGVGYVGTRGIYHSPDGGAHGNATLDLSTGLPGIPDGASAMYTDDGSRLYIHRDTTSDTPTTTYTVEFPDGTIETFGQYFLAATPSSGGTTTLGYPIPEFENEEPSFMEVPLASRRPSRYWGLTSIGDRFGKTLLTVSYVGADGTATAWQIDHITLASGKIIAFTWGTVTVLDGNNDNPSWPVLSSIGFPASGSQTLTVSFGVSPHSFGRNTFDQGTLDGAYCASPITVAAPALDSITFAGGGITGTYRYSFTTDFSNANSDLRGTLTRISLPTGGSISYVYGSVTLGGNGICQGLIYPAGQCSDPETGINTNGPNAPIIQALNPGPKSAFQSYLDRSAAVASRTDASGTISYNRYTYIPVNPNDINQPLIDRTVRRILVTRPDGNGTETLVTKYLLHVPDPDLAVPPGDAGIEIERRYYGAGDSGTGIPVRSLINCTSGDAISGTLAVNSADTATCGYRASASTFQSYYYVGNVRQKTSVTWFGANPTASDGGGSCSDSTTPCSKSASSQYTYPASGVANSTNLADAGHYRVGTVQGSNLPGSSGAITRTTTTDWTPPTSAWLPELYDSKSTSDSGAVSAAPLSVSTSYGFNTSNGFLNSTSTTDANGTLTASSTDDGSGNPGVIKRQGSGTGLSTTLFTDSLSFQAGLALSQQRTGISWKSFDATRDAATGLIVSSRDPNALQTSYSYDALGRIKVIDPPGNPAGNPPGEASTFVCYDSPTMTTTYRIVSDPGCASDASTTAAFLSWERFTYDGLGRLSREIRQLPGAFAVRLHSYDSAGHEKFTSEWATCSSAATCATASPASGTASSNYDPFDRPRIVTRADGTCTWFDRTDGAIAHSETYEKTAAFASTSCSGTTFPTATPVSGPTFTRKDILGRVILVQEAPAFDIVGGTPTSQSPQTTYLYNVLDKVAQVVQGSQTRRFTYDVFGFLRSEQNPEKGAAGNGTTSYSSYNALGNVLSETDNGIVYTSTYDAAGRLKTLATNENTSTTYLTNTYDANFSAVAPYNYSRGRLTSRVAANAAIAGASVTDTFTYGTASTGQLSAQTTHISPGLAATQSWTYNALGLVAIHNHPRASGTFPVTHTYTLGLPTSITANGTTVASAVSYNPAGVLKSWTDGAGVTTTISPNVIPTRPSGISTSNGAFNTQTYVYDAAGNITAIGADSFKYDSRSRLVSAAYSGQTSSSCKDTLGNLSRGQCYSYDRFGNLTDVAGIGARALATSTTANRLTVGTGTSYDARGNLTFFNSETLTWDGLNRQTRDQSAGADWKYLYDGANERVAKVPASGTAFYTFRDQGGHVATEYAGTTVGRDNVFLGNLMVASYASSALSGAVGWTYYHSDHLGTPRYITGVEGPFSPKYWPYGDEVVNNTTSQKLRFATMERDLESNHFYDHARSHDWKLGRFVSVDLIGGNPAAPLTWNRYSYAGQNPIRFLDPNGNASAEAKGIFQFVRELVREALSPKGTPPKGDEERTEALREAGLSDEEMGRSTNIGGRANAELADAAGIVSGVAAEGLVDYATNKASERLLEAVGDIVVIGRREDTAVAREWAGHTILDMPMNEWTETRNIEWVDKAIERRARVYLASPLTRANVRDVQHGRQRMYAKEVIRFFKAGYRRVGHYLIPPLK